MSSTASSSQGIQAFSANIRVNSIRVNAPVVQEWPWENGLPLEHGSMQSSLQNSLWRSETPQEPAFVSMVLVSCTGYVLYFSSTDGDIQKFAKALDDYDARDSYRKEDRQFAWEYLGGRKGKTQARSTIMDLDQWSLSQVAQIDSVAHGLMRYRLIDILANVLDCEKNQNRKSFCAVQHPTLPPRVEGVSAVIYRSDSPTNTVLDTHFPRQLATHSQSLQHDYPQRRQWIAFTTHEPLIIHDVFTRAGSPADRTLEPVVCCQKHQRDQTPQGHRERPARCICPVLVWNGMFQSFLTCNSYSKSLSG